MPMSTMPWCPESTTSFHAMPPCQPSHQRKFEMNSASEPGESVSGGHCFIPTRGR